MADLVGGRFGANRWSTAVKPAAPATVTASTAPAVVAPPPAAMATAPVVVAPAVAVTDPFAAPSAPAVVPAAVADPAAALAAVVAGTAATVAPAAPSISNLSMDTFFRPDDFIAGQAKSLHIDHQNVTVAYLHFDGADFIIESPDLSGITYDVTKGIATTTDIEKSERLQDGDVILIKIPGQADQFRWTWQTPEVCQNMWNGPAFQSPLPAPLPPAVPAALALRPLTADEVHDKLTPQQNGAVDSTSVLSPSDICFRVETLREISDGVWAAMVANGSQGSIEGLSGVGHTSRGENEPVNRTGIGYAVVRSTHPSITPVEISIAAEGTNAEASGIVIEEILAALTRVDASVDTTVQRIASLVEAGIQAAHPRIQALAANANGSQQGTTVQVSIVQDDVVVNLWIGDTVGFAIHAATGFGGLYNPAHSRNRMPFTPPQVHAADGTPIAGGITDELQWLQSARAAVSTPILLGPGDYTPPQSTLVNNQVVLRDGGWNGMATNALLGKGLGLGDIRHAILDDTAEGVYDAALRIMDKWAGAVDSEKPTQIRGSQMSSREAHAQLPRRTITDGSTALWLSRVASPKKLETERKAAEAILRRLRKHKPRDFAISNEQLRRADTQSLLGAAALARYGRYPNPDIIRRILGIPATTP